MKATRVPEWLQHLRTDRRGLPVPYVNRWGLVDDPALLSIEYDMHVRGPGVFYDDRAETEPDFTRQHVARQRECMSAGLCQVCAHPVPWSRRFLVVAGLSVERIHLAGREVAVVTEPWLCERCAHFATSTCPALIRRTRDEDLTLIPITSKRDVQMIASRGWVEGPLEEHSREVQPAMWVKLALTGVRLEAAS